MRLILAHQSTGKPVSGSDIRKQFLADHTDKRVKELLPLIRYHCWVKFKDVFGYDLVAGDDPAGALNVTEKWHLLNGLRSDDVNLALNEGTDREPNVSRAALMLTLGVVTPVAVAERRGLAATLARTARLMSAGRWAFFGLYLLFQLLVGVCVVAAPLLFNALRISPAINLSPMRSILFELLSDILQALWAVVAAMCYRQFRRQIDGPAPGEAAEIFA